MRLLVSWLRDFVDVEAPAEEIGERLGLRGFELAAIEQIGGGDAVIDFEITANRPDCLSVIGLAREVAVAYDRPLKYPEFTSEGRLKADTTYDDLKADATYAGSVDQGLEVAVDDVDLCPRYAAAVADVTAVATPPWMASRLHAAGLRSINAIVDMTNYVLIELGHPTHAFDLDKLTGGQIRVRRAVRGERIRTLDGIDRTLDPDMLVIADRERAQAVAGVMGGSAAEVSSATRRVAFESAYFTPSSVRRTSKRLGLKTEASSRFERGADISAPIIALARIRSLMHLVGAGRFAGSGIDVYPEPRNPRRLHMRRTRMALLLGALVPDDEVDRILRHLGLVVTEADDGWDAVVPTFRVDLVREVDLIEEVGRHYGLDRLPATFPVVTAPAPAPDARLGRDAGVRRVLTAAGLSEAVTFGFVEAKAAEAFLGADADRPIDVANPLSAKFDTLRPSLLPGVVDALAHNRRHGRDDVGLFEIGRRFSSRGETRAVAIAWTGSAPPPHWSTPPRAVDFFDVKGIVEQLCDALSVRVRFAPARERFLVDGQTASVVVDDNAPAGVVGLLAPAVADGRGLPRQDRVFVAELDLDRLWDARRAAVDAVRPLPRHPFVVRDVSVIVPDTLPAEIIRGTIQTVGGATAAPLVGVAFFDRYQGKGIPDRSVSLSARMTFQAPDRTLTDADVQASVDAIVAALVREHGAVQR